MKFTLSVRSFHVPPTPGTCAWPPSLPSVPTSRATRVTSAGEGVELVDHRVDGVFEFENFAFHIDGILAGEITTGHSGGHFCKVRTCAVRLPAMAFDGIRKILPRSGDAGDDCLTTELPSVPTSRATRVTSEANDRNWSTIVLMASLSWRISPADVHRNFAGKVAACDGPSRPLRCFGPGRSSCWPSS